MANDHYVPRFLTEPWEGPPQRSLRYYDFDSQSFGRDSSRHLFAHQDLNDRETEGRLNRWIETPVSRHLAGRRVRGERTVLQDPGDWETTRALACLWLFQAERLRDARAAINGMPDATATSAPNAEDETLAAALAKGETYLDQLVSALLQRSHVLVATIPPADWLVFNDLAYFVIPVVGGPPLVALPLSTIHFVTVAGRAVPDEALQRAVNLVSPSLTVLSVGVSKRVKRVVIPPDQYPAIDANPAGFASMLRLFRETAPRKFNLHYEIADGFGLPAWKVDE